MSDNPIRLRRAVGPDRTNSPFDVLTVKDALGRLGVYSLERDGFSPEPTKALFDAIRFHQDGRKLKVDGIIAPKGETARDIGNLLKLVGNRSPQTRCITPNCGAWHGNMYGTGRCEKCVHKMFPGMLPSEIMDSEDGVVQILPETDE